MVVVCGARGGTYRNVVLVVLVVLVDTVVVVLGGLRVFAWVFEQAAKRIAMRTRDTRLRRTHSGYRRLVVRSRCASI